MVTTFWKPNGVLAQLGLKLEQLESIHLHYSNAYSLDKKWWNFDRDYSKTTGVITIWAYIYECIIEAKMRTLLSMLKITLEMLKKWINGSNFNADRFIQHLLARFWTMVLIGLLSSLIQIFHFDTAVFLIMVYFVIVWVRLRVGALLAFK